MLECRLCGFLTARLAGLRSHQYAIHGRASGLGAQRSSTRSRRLDLSELPESSTETSPDADDERDSYNYLGSVAGSTGFADQGGLPDQPAVGDECRAPVPPISLEIRDDVDGDNPPIGSRHVRFASGAGGLGIPPVDADENGSYDAAVDDAIKALFELTRTSDAAVGHDGQPLPSSEYNYASLATKVRAVYESLNDVARSEPLTQMRRGAKTGRFNTRRLRALLRFALQIGRGGLTNRELRLLYDFVDIWCGTKPGMPSEEADGLSLRDVFPSVNSFVNGVNDEVREAVIDAGWRKVRLSEGGVTYEAYFRPVLDIIMNVAKRPGVQLWSGPDGPAPPTDRRQTPMDGDAFRECEKDVVLNNGTASCVLGVHAYSDASRLS